MKPGGETEAAINEELSRQGNRPENHMASAEGGVELAAYRPRNGGSREQRISRLRRDENRILRDINRVRSQLYNTSDPDKLARLRRESDSLHRQLSHVRAQLRQLGA